MKNRFLKDWTILIYANGNNEFEPEMVQLMLDAEKIGSGNNINVVIQIGRVEKKLVKILRPKDTFIDVVNSWIGVRRYYVIKNNGNNHKLFYSTLLKELGKINMANPKVLYDFIKWGIEEFPAKKYMLILGGHSFEYLGLMTDYTQDIPYIMGIPEMCRALNLIKKNTKKDIDILVLDTCYMNMVEVLYELAKEKNHTVKNVLTYIEYGPIAGLPVDKLLNIVERNKKEKDIQLLIKKIIEDLDLDLVAFNLNNKKLERIKRTSNYLAEKLLTSIENNKIELSEILESNVTEALWSEDVKDLKTGLTSLIIHSKRVSDNKSYLLNIAHKKTTNKLAVYYFKLSFTQNNYWAHLLGKDLIRQSLTLEKQIQLKPTLLPLQALVTLISIMNPEADEKGLELILHNLIEYKGWEQCINLKLNN